MKFGIDSVSAVALVALFAALPWSGVFAVEISPELIGRYENASLAEKQRLEKLLGVSRAEIEAYIGSSLNQPASPNGDVVVLTQIEKPSPQLEKPSPPQGRLLQAAHGEANDVKPKINPAPDPSDGLKRFGAEMFDPEVSSFALADNLPVSEDYLLGVGDELHVQLIGKESATLQLPVNRDGSVVFPRIGKISVAGLNFGEIKALLKQRVNEAFVGNLAIINLGPLRKINVFAAGAVVSPGNHAVLSTTTLMQMLFIVGGPAELGSFRNIELHRAGKRLTSVDLYDLLLTGTRTDDIRLQNGDVLFVPTMGPSIGIRGRVRRPAQYEMRDGETMQDAIRMADGLMPDALMVPAILRRRLPNAELRTLVDIDLRDLSVLDFPIFDGDLLTVAQLPARYENPLKIVGAVEQPGLFAWTPGVRVSHFFPSVHGRLTDGADLKIGLIMRRRSDRQSVDLFSFGLGNAINQADTEADPLLKPHDEVFVFDRFASRTALLQAVVAQLEAQATIDERPRTVTVRGAVADPGVFPLVMQQTVSDLIELAGGSPYLNLDVDMDIAVIIRRDAELVNKVEAIPFRLDEALKKRHTAADPLLMPMDELLILSETDGDGKSNRRQILHGVVERFERQATLSERAQVVQVVGEVREPGHYPILNTLSIGHLIELAGGFTEAAYTKVAEVHRTTLSEDEVLTNNIMTIALTNSDATAQVLQSRDVLRVNRNPGWRETELVTVSGEVKFPGTYPLRPGEKLSAVMARAGGVTSEAFVKGAVFTSSVAKDQQLGRVDQYFTYLSKGALIFDSRQSEEFESVQVLKGLVQGEVTGRVVIDLQGILAGAPSADVTIQSGDTLHVPPKGQLVSVVGEVFSPGDASFRLDFDVGDYIEKAGGLTRFSDGRRAYVIRADGSVSIIGEKGLFKKRWRSTQIEPGDTIVVPVDLAYESAITRLATFSRVAFESLASIGVLLNVSRR